MFKKRIDVNAIVLLLLATSLKIHAQKTLAIDNKGTMIDVINNMVTSSATAPTTPTPNNADIWFDTSNPGFTKTNIYDENTASWITVTSLSQTSISVVEITAADTTIPPLSEQNSTLIVRPQANGNTSNVSLPEITTVPVGKIYTIKRIDHDGTNIVIGTGFTNATVTISANGAELIDGKSSYIGLNATSKKVQIQSDGTHWYVIGE